MSLTDREYDDSRFRIQPPSLRGHEALLSFFPVLEATGPADCVLCPAAPGPRPEFREYTSHRPKLRIFIGLALLVESESGAARREEKKGGWGPPRLFLPVTKASRSAEMKKKKKKRRAGVHEARGP